MPITPEYAQILREYAEEAAHDMKLVNTFAHTGSVLEFLAPGGMMIVLRVSIVLHLALNESDLADHVYGKLITVHK